MLCEGSPLRALRQDSPPALDPDDEPCGPKVEVDLTSKKRCLQGRLSSIPGQAAERGMKAFIASTYTIKSCDMIQVINEQRWDTR